jgi:hypothetical protein
MPSTTLKIYFTLPNGSQEIRRFSTDAVAGQVYAALVGFLTATYSKFFQPPLRFVLQYEDPDGDRCSVSSEQELQEGISLSGPVGSTMKLHVRFEESAEGPASPSLSSLASGLTSPSGAGSMLNTEAVEAAVNKLVIEETNAEPVVEEQAAPAAAPAPVVEKAVSPRSDDGELVNGSDSEDEYVRLEEDGVESRSQTVRTSTSASVGTNAAPASAEFATQTPGTVSAEIPTQTPAAPAAEVVATQTEPKVTHADSEPVSIEDVTGHQDQPEPSPTNPRIASGKASSSSSSAEGRPVVHRYITCDGCGMSPIVGNRYKCMTCNVPGGFDLCEECESSGVKHSQDHLMMKMRAPQNSPIEMTGLAGGRCPRRRWMGPKPKAQFISDVTVADGVRVAQGETLKKVWSIKNVGDCPWPAGTRLVFSGGDLAPQSQNRLDEFSAEVPFAGPGDVVHIAIDIVVPEEAGRFRGTFRLQTPDGLKFGDRLWIDVTAEDEAQTSKKAEPAAEEPAKAAAPAPASASVQPAAPVPVALPVAQPVIAVPVPSAPASDSKQAEEEQAAARGPRFQYANELATLRSMGFSDVELCRYLLLNNQGDVTKVVSWLLNNTSN